MRLTDDLIEEHKLIKKLIGFLSDKAKLIEEGSKADKDFFEKAVYIIKNFADKFHHAKEEDILSVEMVKKGMPEKDSPIEAMLIEHEQGREFVSGMALALERLDKDAGQAIIQNARGYIELLNEHIDKEDNILYPLAERMFTQAEKQKMLKEFKRAERGKLPFKEYQAMIGSLERR